ncbi:MAG: sensor histidine kinase [Arcticibacter sp.]
MGNTTLGQTIDSAKLKSNVLPPISTPAILDSARALPNGNWIERVKYLIIDNKSKEALVILKQQGELVKSYQLKQVDSLRTVLKSFKDSANSTSKNAAPLQKDENAAVESETQEGTKTSTEQDGSSGVWLLVSMVLLVLSCMSLLFIMYRRLSHIKRLSQNAKKQFALLQDKIELQPQLEKNISSLSADIDHALELTAAETDYMAEIINDKNNPNIKPAKEIITGTQILKRMVSELPKSNSVGLRKTNVNRLIEEVSVQAYYSMRDHYPDFSCDMRRDLEKILPDTELNAEDIRFVLFNILENAFESVWLKKASSGKGYQPSVTITSRKLPRYIQVRVKDNGVGISDSVRKQIFSPFFSDKDDNQHVGLGLHESYDLIVNKYKGDLILENDFQSSTDFIIRLPLKL